MTARIATDQGHLDLEDAMMRIQELTGENAAMEMAYNAQVEVMSAWGEQNRRLQDISWEAEVEMHRPSGRMSDEK